MKRVSRHLRVSVIRLASTIIVILSLFLVYRNVIHKVIRHIKGYPFVFDLAPYEVSISESQKDRSRGAAVGDDVRIVKVSIPFSDIKWGCEFLYGAAVLRYPDESTVLTSASYHYSAMRYLLKFKYDLKTKRCESKDLVVPSDDIPQNITIQFIKIELRDREVLETPDATGVRIDFDSNRDVMFSPRAATIGIPARFPFRKVTTTPRGSTFSLRAKASDVVTPVVQPFDNLHDVLLNEIHERKNLCVTTRKCGTIKSAVAGIFDDSILLAFDEARQAGIDVEIITNQISKDGGLQSPVGPYKHTYEASPWIWLRSNKQLTTSEESLPMHLKFTIFDNDVVISSNANYSFDTYANSREAALIYRSNLIANIFSEIFAMTRTTLFYPIGVDLNDDIVILFNADRPRGYSASDLKPYLSITTNEGREGSAYGILFSLIERFDGPLSLMMSPVTNSCASYEKNLCLFDVLRSRRERGALKEYWNYFFFRDPALNVEDKSLRWTEKEVEKGLQLRKQSAAMLTGVDLQNAHLYTELGKRGSVHHERLALLGDDITIAGSANWARPSTFNTIEIIRDRGITKRFREEEATYEEPWIVIKKKVSPSAPPESACEFVFEVDLLAKTTPMPRTKLTINIRRALSEKGGEFGDEYSLIEPASDWRENPHVNYIKRALPQDGSLLSMSSYHCIKNERTQQVEVVRSYE